MFVVMEYQGNLELYLNMTRKELQTLCKKYQLPANRTHAQLAKSLASYFNKKRANSTSSGPRSISQNVSGKTSYLRESKSVAGAFGRPSSSEGVTHQENFGPNEVIVDGSPNCLLGNQTRSTGHMPDATAKFACPFPTNSKNADCFISEPNNLGKGPCTAGGIRKTITTQFLGFGCEGDVRSKSKKSLKLKNTRMLLPDAVTTSRTSNTVLVSHVHNKVHESLTQSEFVSAGEFSTTPSLQFFVMSEEGINLHVDLNSEPLEWVNSLKNEVCINQKEENNEPVTHTCGLPNIDDFMETIPSGITRVDLQNNEVEGNAGCADSGLSSVVSENCNLNAYPVDTTAGASGSSVLMLTKVPADLSGCLEENQVVSSSHATYGVQGHSTADTASCRREGITLLQEFTDACCGIIKSDASVHTTKSAESKDNGSIAPATADCITYDSAGHDAVLTLCECDTVNHVSAENNHPTSSEIQVTIEASHFPNVENQIEVCKNSFTGHHVNELPDTAGICEGSSSSCAPMQMILDGQMADAQSEVGTTVNIPNQQPNHDYETLALEDQMQSNDHLESRTPSRGKDSSNCSRDQSFCGNTSKRSGNIHHVERLHSKRQHVHRGNTHGTTIKSKGIKTTKDSISDASVLPRRSTRLTPK